MEKVPSKAWSSNLDPSKFSQNALPTHYQRCPMFDYLPSKYLRIFQVHKWTLHRGS